MDKPTFKDDSPAATGGEFRLRRSRVYLGGKHVGNIYAGVNMPPADRTVQNYNAKTTPDFFYYSPLGKFNQQHFHGDRYGSLEACKLSL